MSLQEIECVCDDLLRIVLALRGAACLDFDWSVEEKMYNYTKYQNMYISVFMYNFSTIKYIRMTVNVMPKFFIINVE